MAKNDYTINAYKFRIYPNEEQEHLLWNNIGCCRKTYNLLIDEYDNLYQRHLAGEITKKELTSLQHKLDYVHFSRQDEYSYLKKADSRALTYARNFAQTAHKNFLSGKAGHPQFKKFRTSRWSYKTDGNIKLLSGGRLKLPKIPGYIKTIVHQNPKGNLQSAIISKERSGKWFVSLLFRQKPVTPPENTKPAVGLDMGISHLVVTSDGVTYDNIRALYTYEKKLARLDKSLSRKRKAAKKRGQPLSECKNYQKELVKRARVHEKVKNIRHNHIHNITRDIVNNYGVVVVETLAVKKMMETGYLAKHISDASWSMLINQLDYKLERSGGQLIKIDRFFPSSQICSECGAQTGTECKDLSVREWTCTECGATHDRDSNAAKNILAEGIRMLVSAEDAKIAA